MWMEIVMTKTGFLALLLGLRKYNTLRLSRRTGILVYPGFLGVVTESLLRSKAALGGL